MSAPCCSDPKSFEGHGGQRALNPRDVQEAVIDEFADVLVIGNVELHQEIEVTAGRIKLGMDFAQNDVFGNLVRGPGFAADLNEHALHDGDPFRSLPHNHGGK